MVGLDGNNSPALSQSGFMVASLGRWFIGLVRQVLSLIELLGMCFVSIRRVESRQVFAQAYGLANRSIFFVVVIMAFTGAILVVQACSQAQRVIYDLSFVGPGFLQLVVREFGPTIVAMMIAARFGAGVAAEIGAMQTSEQIDALRMTGADVVSFLVAPRVWGGFIGMFPITVLGSVVTWMIGGVVAHHVFAVGWDTFFSVKIVGIPDLAIGIAKTLCFGIAVPLVSAQAGLSASGGASGVGKSTTQAVVGSSIAILALDFLVGALGHIVFW